MNRKRITIGVAGVMLSLSVAAQTIVWEMRPTDYSNVERYGYHLFQVSKDGKNGLIHSDGSMVVPLGYDQITDYYEHKALVLKNENGKERVLGYLTEDGHYKPFSTNYYTLSGQAFYSDGMLSVSDAKGRPGYLNEQGSPVLGFDGKWDRIKPFTEGHAAVFKNKKYMLIDKNGTKATFIIGNGIELLGGRNVYQGKALIYDTYGKFYSYDVSTKKCSACKEPANKQSVDYLYCFASISGRGKEPPYTTLPSGIQGLSPFKKDGLFGYAKDSRVILPAQFTSASVFEDELAIVNLQGSWGILKYRDEGTDFALSVPKSHFEYTPGVSISCTFQLSTPAEWQKSGMEVMLKDHSTGEEMPVSKDADIYSFKLHPSQKEQSYDVIVTGESLKLWQGELSYTFKKKEENLHVQLSMSTHRANENDQVPVIATITNAGSEAVTATITMSGSAAFNRVTRTETISAGHSIQVSSYFTVRKDLTDQYVSVTTSKGGHASKTGLSLSAFY